MLPKSDSDCRRRLPLRGHSAARLKTATGSWSTLRGLPAILCPELQRRIGPIVPSVACVARWPLHGQIAPPEPPLALVTKPPLAAGSWGGMQSESRVVGVAPGVMLAACSGSASWRSSRLGPCHEGSWWARRPKGRLPVMRAPRACEPRPRARTALASVGIDAASDGEPATQRLPKLKITGVPAGAFVWHCPAPTSSTPAQRSPSMGLRGSLYHSHSRGIPNLSPPRPLFPEGGNNIESHLVLPTPSSRIVNPRS